MSSSGVDSLVEQADALRAIGRFDDAIALMHRALTIDPEHYEAITTLGLAQLGAGKSKDALDTAARAAVIRPEAPLPHRIRAVALRSLGRTRDALDAARRSAALAPEHPSSHQLLSELLSDARKHREAVEAGHRAVALDPDSATAHEALGFALLRAKKLPEAEEALRTSLALDPERAAARFNLALVLRLRGKAEEAMGITRSLIVESPGDTSNVQAMVGHANAYLREGPVNQAMKTMMRLAVLRVPIVIAVSLWPFAWLERRRRRALLPPGMWEAIERAKSSAAMRIPLRRRVMGYGLIGFGVLCMVFVAYVLIEAALRWLF